jgi:hypothetical protein
MSGCSDCGTSFNTPKEYLDFVYKLPTLLEKEIDVLKPSRKRLYTGMVTKGSLPTNVSTNYQKFKVHTPRFRQFNNAEMYHSKQERAHGPTAAGGANAHCTVGPFHKLNGLGYERVTLAHRRSFFETCKFCVETLWRDNIAPEDFFSEYMQGVRDQLDDIIEITHRNEYEERAQKVWAIYNSDGRLLQKSDNPFDWASLPNATQLSLPSVEMLYNFAEDVLSSYSDYYSIGSVDGEPVYPLIMNSRTKHNLVYKNPQLVQMIQFSSMADSLIEMWQGPISKIGPFVIFVDNDSTRLKIENGVTQQIPHWIPTDAPDGGEMWVEHPEWRARGLNYVDTIMIPRKDSWKKLIRRIPTSIGGVQFGEELSPEMALTYINIKDINCNPFGWIGHFVASHEYYIEPGDNLAVAPGYQIGVHSGIPGLDMLYEEQPACPAQIVLCNTVDDTGCPCMGIKCITVNPTNPAQMFVTFTQTFSPALVAGGTVSLKTRTGGVQTVTVAAPLSVSADALTYLFNVAPADLANGPIDPEDYVEVACQVVEYCESAVIGLKDCRSQVSNAVTIFLDKPLKCSTVGDLITLSFKGGYQADFIVVTANNSTLEYVVRYAPGFGPTEDPTGLVAASTTWDLCCDRGQPTHACCVPTVANGCLGCEVTFEKCDGTTVTQPASQGGCGC